jgi:hypothetical protein
MNLNTLASVTLGAQVFLLPTILVVGSRLDRTRRLVVLAIAGGWLLLVTALADAGIFVRQGIGTPLLGIAVTTPIVATLLLRNRSATLHTLITSIPLTWLVVIHVSRIIGVDFLALHAAGRLPASFAYSAGWGDIIVGIASLPLAFLVYRKAQGWRPLLLAWNCLGVIDLIAAVTLGAASAEGSPIRFIYQEPSSALMGTLPWFLIPGFLVPLYLITHAAIFFRLFVSNERISAYASHTHGHIVT